MAEPQPEQPIPPQKSPGTTLIAAALGVILAMVVVAFFVLRRSEKPPPPAAPSHEAAAPAGYSKPAPGMSAARKAQMAQAEPVQTVPASEPASSGPREPTSQLRLTTSPPGADVTVDGKRETGCKSPCTFDLSPGVHTLIAKKEGYRATLQTFQVSGEEDEVAITLNPITGSLQLQTDPAGATIAVDGNARTEVTPATLALPVGKYRVRLTHAGFAPYEFEAVILPESVREISVRLAR